MLFVGAHRIDSTAKHEEILPKEALDVRDGFPTFTVIL